MVKTTRARVIGQRIRQRRECVPWIDDTGLLREGMSQKELADRLFIRQPSVSQWETGKALPATHHQWALAEHLRTTHAALFDVDDLPAAA